MKKINFLEKIKDGDWISIENSSNRNESYLLKILSKNMIHFQCIIANYGHNKGVTCHLLDKSVRAGKVFRMDNPDTLDALYLTKNDLYPYLKLKEDQL